MRIYAGRRNRERLDAMRYALAQNKDKGATAMKEALAQVADAGRAAGAAIAETRKPPCVPGRIREKIAAPKPAVVVPGRRIRPLDPVAEAVTRVFPQVEVTAVEPPKPKKIVFCLPFAALDRKV